MEIIVKHLEGKAREVMHSGTMFAYLEGKCYEFAIALNQGLGWSMVGFMRNGEVYHVGVRSPEGAIYDARGQVTEEQFTGHFSFRPEDIVEVSEEDLLVARSFHQEAIKTARNLAEKFWPELPWKNSELSRAHGFVVELARVCDKHGYCLSGIPDSFPVAIRKAEGDETIELGITEDTSCYTISRAT